MSSLIEYTIEFWRRRRPTCQKGWLCHCVLSVVVSMDFSPYHSVNANNRVHLFVKTQQFCEYSENREEDKIGVFIMQAVSACDSVCVAVGMTSNSSCTHCPAPLTAQNDNGYNNQTKNVSRQKNETCLFVVQHMHFAQSLWPISPLLVVDGNRYTTLYITTTRTPWRWWKFFSSTSSSSFFWIYHK